MCSGEGGERESFLEDQGLRIVSPKEAGVSMKPQEEFLDSEECWGRLV